MTALLFLALILSLTGSAHPFVTYPLSLRIIRPFIRKPVVLGPVDGARPTLAILMSAYNEERVIEAKIEQLLLVAAAYGPARIHVYVDGSSDRTPELLKPYADRIDLVISTERRGKTAGLKRLWARADAELLGFTDANVDARPEAFIELARAFADPEVSCAAPRLMYAQGDTAIANVSGAYWGLEERIKALESETVGVVGVDGSMFMMRHSAYKPPPDHLIDDLYVSVRALLDGGRVVSLPQVHIFEASASRTSEEFRRKARIACQAVNVHGALWPRLVRASLLLLYAYVSHRLLKWMLPFNLLLSALLILALFQEVEGWPLTFAVLAVMAGGGAAIYLLPLDIARRLRAIIASLAGVGLGVIQSIVFKQTYTVWSPAASVREAA